MRKQNKSMLILVVFMAFITIGLFFAGVTRTVDAAPRGIRYVAAKVDMIDDRVCEIGKILESGKAPVAKTGQAISYAPGDDGALQKGVAVGLFIGQRFRDNGNGTVTDNLTGLIWLKNANRFPTMFWEEACDVCNILADDGEELTDGSSPGDWRLPNVRELQSLINYGRAVPALPTGAPFENVQSDFPFSYWSSTTDALYPGQAWYVSLRHGDVNRNRKDNPDFCLVWCVRGGQ